MHEKQTLSGTIATELLTLSNSDSLSSLLDLFRGNPHRSEQFRLRGAMLQLDFSRQHVDQQVIDKLIGLAREHKLQDNIQSMFNGLTVNSTEKRAALHVALRNAAATDKYDDEIRLVINAVSRLTSILHSGNWQGYDGRAITDVVNIGIGGSDLGPRMVVEALKPYRQGSLKVHYASNMDPVDIHQTLTELDPGTTLFVIVSKSWRTPETLSNANIAREWLHNAGGNEAISRQCVAVSTAIEQCREFGINAQHILPMWDWAGGRFSLWSAVGLSIAFSTGFDHFSELLSGAREMDTHFISTPLEKNLPAIAGLLDIWQINFRNAHSLAVLPYSHNLHLLTDHLQQLIMESNGKSVSLQGAALPYSTGQVIWGAAGTNGQHSFHQLLHQGTDVIPAEFVLPLKGLTPYTDAHAQLVANCLAQAEVLMDGRPLATVIDELLAQGMDEEEARQLAPHKVMPGNRPSTIISMEKLSPRSLGALIAFYEHRVFTSSVIWKINAFDQWGVELGKVVASRIHGQLDSASPDSQNPATRSAIMDYQRAHLN